MKNATRDRILNRLYKAQRSTRPFIESERPPTPAEQMADEQLLADRFKTLIEAQGGCLERASGNDEVLKVLADIFNRKGISRAMASTDRVISPLDLPGWAKETGFSITTQKNYEDRTAFKRAVFTEVDAGITGAAFGFAESGTICLMASENMSRLTSLAPIIHIAVLPSKQLIPAYEQMAEAVFGETPPSQLILITGPSMTGDIQATPFKGMHGPRELVVILRDD